jgi:hypothetical protein
VDKGRSNRLQLAPKSVILPGSLDGAQGRHLI